MKRPSRSTTLLALAYDNAHGVLRLEFRSRAIYHYYGVPAAVHEALLGAPSKGSYFNRVIRGRFPCALCATRLGLHARRGSEGQRRDSTPVAHTKG
ncbi:MAG: KTSC domain-containing protein [Bryobacteraceae bacterium]|nr:KTSC domain-containing protein [Bryobacteraceae bacterium]